MDRLPAWLLTILALVVAAVDLGLYWPKVRALRVPRRPLGHEAGMLLAAALSIGGFAAGPGLATGAVGAFVVLTALLFLASTRLSGLPRKSVVVRVGEPFRDFTALDSEGRSFRLSSLAGRPILLKFFRGHW